MPQREKVGSESQVVSHWEDDTWMTLKNYCKAWRAEAQGPGRGLWLSTIRWY